MIFIDRRFLIVTILIIILLLFAFIFMIFCAFFAYQENTKRAPDDTEKKDFSPIAPWLSPCTPIIWLGKMILLAPWSIPFGIFLILFPFILIIFRPLPDKDPLKLFILKFGNGVLKINTQLLYLLGLDTKPIKFSFN
jgi:hypothetical protein